jgi:hypothetical protein
MNQILQALNVTGKKSSGGKDRYIAILINKQIFFSNFRNFFWQFDEFTFDHKASTVYFSPFWNKNILYAFYILDFGRPP